jgi:hypothetical protein
MSEKEEKILKAVHNQIIRLISEKKSGRIDITLELNMSQGTIGSADIRNNCRETIFSPK